MRYVFFDTECCDGKSLCEFGYRVTDENFCVTDAGCVTINPEARFNLTGRSYRKDLILAYPEKVYGESPTFPAYYDFIKSVLTAEDCLVIGFSTASDVDFLDKACKRYGLDTFDFPFVDCQILYSASKGINRRVSMDDAAEELGIEKRENDVHRSDFDAEMTKDLLLSMCRMLEVSPSDVTELCPECFIKDKREVLKDAGKDEYDRFDSFFEAMDCDGEDRVAKIKAFFRAYLNVAVPAQGSQGDELRGRRFCLSWKLVKESPREAFLTAQTVVNRGGRLGRKYAECDVYIASDGEIDSSGPRIGSAAYRAKLCGSDVMTVGDVLALCGMPAAGLDGLRLSEYCRVKKNKLRRAKNYSPDETVYFYEFFRDLDLGLVHSAAERRTVFDSFRKYATAPGGVPDGPLNGKRFAVSGKSEKESPRELFIVMQMIRNGGGILTGRASEAEFYIATEDELNGDDPEEGTRLFFAICRDVQIISYADFYRMAGYTPEETEEIECSEFCRAKCPVAGRQPSVRSSRYSADATVFELTRNANRAGRK